MAPSLNPKDIYLVIRAKLADGRLPLNSIPRIWGGPGQGEICDACERPVTANEFLMEGVSLAEGKKGIHLHSQCFYIWDTLRRL